MISQETIIRFQKAVKKEYGRDITFEEASEILYDLTDYFSTLAKIYHRMQHDL